MSEFDELFHWIEHRDGLPITTIQDRTEMEQIVPYFKKCRSYLEIGTSDGNSLFVYAQFLTPSVPFVCYVDYGEKKTESKRNEVMKILGDKKIRVIPIHGNSHEFRVIEETKSIAPYDIVLIDAGHDVADVIADAMTYGMMAQKYIIFHDICLPAVQAAFNWFVDQQQYKNAKMIVGEQKKFGYGVIELC